MLTRLSRALSRVPLGAAGVAALVLCAAVGTPEPAAARSAYAAASGWWHPPQRLTWYWQLQGRVKNGQPVDAYDIDGFENSAGEVATLHARGTHVICYIDVGTAENFRPDYHQFPASVL